jgi:hypothetical protein
MRMPPSPIGTQPSTIKQKGNHDEGYKYSQQAHEHSRNAHGLSEAAHKKSYANVRHNPSQAPENS